MKKKIIYIAEPPTVNTGFGVVSQQIVPALASEFEIHALCTGGYGNKVLEGLADFGVTKATWTDMSDLHGITQLNKILKEDEPDGIFTYYDVGSVMEYLKRGFISYWPHASYLITEGEPMMRSWCRMFTDTLYRSKQTRTKLEIESIILPSYYSNEVAIRQTGRSCRVAHHGVDHAPFRQFTKEDRRKIRTELAASVDQVWGDNVFVIMYNARNAGRKQWPRLFEAVALAQKIAPEIEFKIVAHTKVFNEYKLEGWGLHDEVYQSGMNEDNVIFSQSNETESLQFVSEPDSKQGSLCKLYNASDLYVHPSSVEGAGIPIMEAAKCGLPVLTTEYAAGWEYGKDFALPIKVQAFYNHSSGVKQALVDIQDLADKIVKVAKNPTLQHQLSAASLKNCNFSWKELQKQSIEAMYEALKNGAA